MVYNLVFRLP